MEGEGGSQAHDPLNRLEPPEQQARYDAMTTQIGRQPEAQQSVSLVPRRGRRYTVLQALHMSSWDAKVRCYYIAKTRELLPSKSAKIASLQGSTKLTLPAISATLCTFHSTRSSPCEHWYLSLPFTMREPGMLTISVRSP